MCSRFRDTLRAVHLVAALLWPVSSVQGSDQAVPVLSAAEVVDRWRPDQHLYLKGELGISRALLDQLEQWLDLKGSNWTVFLAQNASGERYVDAAGAAFTGLDAVEHALGQGLPNKTSFGQLVDPSTAEPNGAFFILFLQERKFSYFGSTAQDRRNLGEDAWSGNLDGPAIAAMRGGGRIVDAVKDTVQTINSRLAKKIASERQDRERQATRAQEAILHARQSAETELAAAWETLLRLDRTGSAFTEQHSLQMGSSFSISSLPLKIQWTNANTLFAGGHAETAAAEATRIRAAAEKEISLLGELARAPASLQLLKNSVAQQRNRPSSSAARDQLQQAEKSLLAAQAAVAQGDASYVNHRQATENALHAADRVISQAARLRQLMVLMAVAGGSGLILLALGLLWGLARRRRAVKVEAEQLYQSWDLALQEKSGGLVELLEKISQSVGASRTEATSRWSGDTLVLAQQIIRDVDELFIMSACAGRVLKDAARVLFPGGLLSGPARRFSKRPYLATLHLLRDQAIAFQPEESLEPIIRGSKKTWQSLLGDLSSYQPFALSFNDLMSGFQQRAQRAVANLAIFDTSVRDVEGFLQALEQELTRLRSAQVEVAAAASADDWFALPDISATVVPALEKGLAEAVTAHYDDPVGALQNRGLALRRQVDLTQGLLKVVLSFRSHFAPRFEQARKSLEAAGLAHSWIDKACHQLSHQCDQLAAQIILVASPAQVDDLQQQLPLLAQRVQDILELERQRQTTTLPALRQTTSKVQLVRTALSEALRLPVTSLLQEKDLEPDRLLASANEQAVALKAALERGDSTAARHASETIQQLCSEAEDLVTRSEEAHRSYPAEAQARQAETDNLRQRVSAHEQLLVQLTTQYQPGALLLRSGDPTFPAANQTVQDNSDEIREHLTTIETLRQEADQAFREGRLLESVGRLEQIKAHQEAITCRFLEITNKQQGLARTEKENDQRSNQLGQKLKDAAVVMTDPRILPATEEQYVAAQDLSDRAASMIGLRPGDPFAAAEILNELHQVIQGVNDLAQRDFDRHAEAQRSLDAAQAQLLGAQRLVDQTAADAIADSAATMQARDSLVQLSRALQQSQAQFQIPHSDWRLVDADADRIAADVTRHTATLRGELAAAEVAARAASNAAAAVRAAGGWTGLFGVQILGSPGSAELENARARLLQGDYEGCRQLATAAERTAQRAVALAEAEMARRRRAEEEERDRERRRREAAEQLRQRRQTNWGSSSSGGGRSSFGSGSGAGRSSFSSGSGAKRSGW